MWRLAQTPFKRTMRPFVKYWLPVPLWIVVIFIGSSDLMSAEHTSRLLVPLLLWLKPDITGEAIVQVHFLLRKCAHLTEYAILAILLRRALYRGTNLREAVGFLYGTLVGGRAEAEIPGKDEFGLKLVAARTPHQIAAATVPQSKIRNRKSKIKMGLTGLEPVTLRLSSACSNQLSYRPASRLFKIADRKSQIGC